MTSEVTVSEYPQRRSALRLLGAGFLLGAVALPLAASGWTVPRMTLHEQGEGADLVAEATVNSIEYIVLDDGYPITEYDLAIDRVISGSVRPDGNERLRLPGGMKDGEMMSEGSPQLRVGQKILLAGRRDRRQTLLLLGGNQSLFTSDAQGESSIATDADGNPITGVRCPEDVLIARPVEEAPREPLAAPSDRVFAPNPRALGLSWSDFTDQMSSCLGASNSRSQP